MVNYDIANMPHPYIAYSAGNKKLSEESSAIQAGLTTSWANLKDRLEAVLGKAKAMQGESRAQYLVKVGDRFLAAQKDLFDTYFADMKDIKERRGKLYETYCKQKEVYQGKSDSYPPKRHKGVYRRSTKSSSTSGWNEPWDDDISDLGNPSPSRGE